MSSSIITILGLLKFNPALFDKMELPPGIDKQLLIDNIIERGGDYEVIYPNADLMQNLIGSWSKRWYNVFFNWQRATNDMNNINPLDNYDRHEEWTDNGTTHSSSFDSMEGSGTTTGHDTSSGLGSVTDTNKISADDSNSFVNRTQDTQSNTTNTSADTSTTSSTTTNTNVTNDGNTQSIHSGHLWGNIGVTTSSQMYREFYDVMRQYGNIYDTITTVFCQSFVIPIF